MSSTCERLDADLLMLVHGELEGTQALRVRAHLVLCSRCRARVGRLGALSGSLASAFQNPRLGSRTFGRASNTAWLSLGLALVLFSGLGWFASNAFAEARPAASLPSPPAPSHCAAPHACSAHPPLAASNPPVASCSAKSHMAPNLLPPRRD